MGSDTIDGLPQTVEECDDRLEELWVDMNANNGRLEDYHAGHYRAEDVDWYHRAKHFAGATFAAIKRVEKIRNNLVKAEHRQGKSADIIAASNARQAANYEKSIAEIKASYERRKIRMQEAVTRQDAERKMYRDALLKVAPDLCAEIDATNSAERP